MKIISSYPRSGQAKLRFLICNLLYPHIDHTFETIRKYTPSIDSAEQLQNCADDVQYLVTHSNIRADIYLHRHVGDVLISEYFYKKKVYDNMNRTLEYWIQAVDYGKEWRWSVECGRGADKHIGFDDLNDVDKLAKLLNFSITEVEIALSKCTFEKMLEAEMHSTVIKGNPQIRYMRSGKSEQWRDLSIRYDILRENEGELYYLGYWSPEKWEEEHKKQTIIFKKDKNAN